VCDLAYVLLLDQLERLLLADRHVAAVFIAAGGDDVTLPTYRERRLLFDQSLAAEPAPTVDVDPEQMELRRALGVA